MNIHLRTLKDGFAQKFEQTKHKIANRYQSQQKSTHSDNKYAFATAAYDENKI